jgi:enoyl-CoA hydratase/carnithine racemase
MSDNVQVQIDGHVGIVEVTRGPHNFFDERGLSDIRDALVDLDAQDQVRSVVLCAEGRNFCAGADLRDIDHHGLRSVYRTASALFTTRKPIVAAIQGAAIGGGLGLALAADLRMAASDVRMTANFARLGFHHGFGLTVTLPRIVGHQRTLDLLYTGRNVFAEEALQIGLVDRIAAQDVRDEAIAWAQEISRSAPLSLVAIRSTLRRQIASEVVAALDEEATAQTALLGTGDFREGISASIEKRDPEFQGS